MKSRPHICLATLILALAAVGWPPGDGTAAETSAVNPTGTWKVTCTLDGKTQTYQPTLKLKQEGDKLTGTFTRRRGQQEIEMALEDVKLEASEISFNVSIFGSGGATVVRKFHGKIAGDTIKEGTVKEIWNGEDRTSEHPLHWEAKRETAKSKDGTAKWENALARSHRRILQFSHLNDQERS